MATRLPVVEVTKVFRFESSHQLVGHKDKCAQLHGHSYKAELTLKGIPIQIEGLSSTGMVVDFGDIKEVWKELIHSVLDHTHLNDALPVRSTGENIALWIMSRLGRFSSLPIYRLRLWETATSYVEVYLVDQMSVEFPSETKDELGQE